MKSESELNAAPERNDGPDSPNLNAQLRAEPELDPARHKQCSLDLLQKGVYVPDQAVEAQAQMVPERMGQKKYGQFILLPCERKVELAFANQLPKKENLKAEFAALNMRMESVNSKVKKSCEIGKWLTAPCMQLTDDRIHQIPSSR